MRAFRLGFLSAAAVLAGLALAPHQAARAEAEATDAFSGVWDVIVTPDSTAAQAGKEAFADEVLFESGNFTASACAKYGFAPAEYTLADGSSFSSTLSGDEGTIVWSATLNGSQFSGTVVWTKPDGHVFSYTLSGVRHVDDGENSGA